ncbi:hypothetical protein MMC25_002041 [Agyrium rufum]|nr:hypothetical protein [Agyrium rufum]
MTSRLTASSCRNLRQVAATDTNLPKAAVATTVAAATRSHFHTSSPHRADDTNHYETLGLEPNATAADIKKKFYTLSKAHHPDLHPKDPLAAKRFTTISAAYSILGNATNRTRYDRDNAHHFSSSSTSSSSSSSSSRNSPRGSYSSSSSSSSHFGSRPASGLSRRKTQFRGPPPSFYKAGGYGSQGARRAGAAGAGGSGSSSSAGSSSSSGGGMNGNTGGGANTGPASGGEAAAGGGGWGGGFSPGQRSPFGPAFGGDVPHFDRQGHFRTQEEQDLRRSRRQQMEQDALGEAAGRGGYLFGFLAVSAILGVVAMVGGAVGGV